MNATNSVNSDRNSNIEVSVFEFCVFTMLFCNISHFKSIYNVIQQNVYVDKHSLTK